MGLREAACFLPNLLLPLALVAQRTTLLFMRPTRIWSLGRRMRFQLVQVLALFSTLPATRSLPSSCPPSVDPMAAQESERDVASSSSPLLPLVLDTMDVSLAQRRSDRAMTSRHRTVCMEFMYWALLAKSFALVGLGLKEQVAALKVELFTGYNALQSAMFRVMELRQIIGAVARFHALGHKPRAELLLYSMATEVNSFLTALVVKHKLVPRAGVSKPTTGLTRHSGRGGQSQ